MVYTNCGNDIHCTDVVYQPALATIISSIPNIKVYPNPANDELNITGILSSTNYRLLSITGISVQQGTFEPGNNSLSMRNFAPGIYILEMTGADGQRSIVRVVKE